MEEKVGKTITSAIWAWLRLVRIEHSIISAFGVLVGLMLATKAGAHSGMQNWIYALLVPVLINAGAFALNDYWDVEADRLNKKNRPLISGELEKNIALDTAIIGLALGAGFGWLISTQAGILATFFAVLSVAYNKLLKDLPLIGNLAVAISMAIAFVFGSLAAGFDFSQIGTSIWILAAGATFAGLGREIVKTVQDMEGDRMARKSKSLPHLIGARNSLLIASVSFCLFAISIPMLVIYSRELQWNMLTLALLALSFFAFLSMAWTVGVKEPSIGDIEKVRKTSLGVLGIALVAILISAV